ncbi:hypothetical protein [Saccharomonospora iraqiensis]|uniref:hypothetical protein n=1 Tax=Saccharomonospora iraqiensis TaxID=52698 RepID=UPI0003F50198|nr:hypothetical protein [Saccharomonospora iraqiensis]
MIGWLAATLGTGVLSAVVPVVTIEVYLVGVRATDPDVPWPALALAAAVGQMAGKMLFFYAGRGGVRLSERLRRDTDPTRSRRWVTWISRFREACAERPRTAAGILFVSASLGLPPFAVIAVVAGATTMGPVRFLILGFSGRTIRFAVLTLAPSLIEHV